jgi:hypothetical protein
MQQVVSQSTGGYIVFSEHNGKVLARFAKRVGVIGAASMSTII